MVAQQTHIELGYQSNDVQRVRSAADQIAHTPALVNAGVLHLIKNPLQAIRVPMKV